jgi:hypothetical protein
MRVHSAAVTGSRRPQPLPSEDLRDGARSPAVSMQFTLRHVGGYLRGDLYHRQSAEETSQFLQALTKEALGSAVDRVLISVHASRAIFRVQQLGLPELFQTIASRPEHRVAMVADAYEGQLAQQYVVTLARQRGLNVRSFRSEGEAIAWLQAR